ncbi:MAG TPA: sugar phosphate isomerase/epimerase [Candidatus Angelobacter sp.]
MSPRISRRGFVAGLGVVAASTALSRRAAGAWRTLTADPGPRLAPLRAEVPPGLLYPPLDLSYFDKPISPAPAEFHLGYASITWGGEDKQAIEDIASLGFSGIQLRSNVIAEFGSVGELKELLQKHRLTFVALSSGGVRIDPGVAAEDLAKHAANAKFVHDAGGLYLQVTDQRPKNRATTADDCKKLGRLLTEVGKRAADLGIALGYHNHMGTLGEKPEDVDRILDSADPRYVKLELDVAHYLQGGGDPAKAIDSHHDRLLFLHIKDVEVIDPPANGKNYRFVELGRGRVDFPAIFAALKRVNFRGWTVVELDAVTDKARTPKESAMISKTYLEEKLGLRV